MAHEVLGEKNPRPPGFVGSSAMVCAHSGRTSPAVQHMSRRRRRVRPSTCSVNSVRQSADEGRGVRMEHDVDGQLEWHALQDAALVQLGGRLKVQHVLDQGEGVVQHGGIKFLLFFLRLALRTVQY